MVGAINNIKFDFGNYFAFIDNNCFQSGTEDDVLKIDNGSDLSVFLGTLESYFKVSNLNFNWNSDQLKAFNDA